MFKGTYMESTSKNKTQALGKSMDMDIWLAGTSYQLYTRGP